MNINNLEQAYQSAKAKGVTPRGLVFINPGNPTGQCLDEANLMSLIKFCVDHNMVIMADEVYQENIYNSTRPFISARATLAKMEKHYQDKAEMISFHTVSKGAYGECGMRGGDTIFLSSMYIASTYNFFSSQHAIITVNFEGYMEIYNMDSGFIDQLYKMSSINLSPNVVGQLAVGIMVNPPKPGDPSYPLFKKEKDEVIESLKRRARRMTDAFNSMEGVTCQETDGAM